MKGCWFNFLGVATLVLILFQSTQSSVWIGLVPTGEAVHPVATSMGTWYKSQMPNCPCLAMQTVLESLRNSGFRNFSSLDTYVYWNYHYTYPPSLWAPNLWGHLSVAAGSGNYTNRQLHKQAITQGSDHCVVTYVNAHSQSQASYKIMHAEHYPHEQWWNYTKPF